VGNFINTPYFNADATVRYAISETGEALSLEEFLDKVEANRIPMSKLEIAPHVEARDDLIRRFEDLARQELFEQAQALVRQRVEPGTWQVFALTCLERRDCAEVAQALGLTLNALYVARSRVKTLLRQTIQALDHEP
jgi:hypothetical protein